MPLFRWTSASTPPRAPTARPLRHSAAAQLTTERPEDAEPIEDLLDAAFGSDRLLKTSYRYRHGLAPVRGLSHVVREPGSEPGAPARIIGSIRYWRIRIRARVDAPALLLGPLAIAHDRQGRGIGAALVFHTLDLAAWGNHRLVLLVGDPAYYARFGFRAASTLGLTMAGEDPERLRMVVLDPEVRDVARDGVVERADPAPRRATPRASRLLTLA